jgi:hypothetical protein
MEPTFGALGRSGHVSCPSHSILTDRSYERLKAGISNALVEKHHVLAHSATHLSGPVTSPTAPFRVFTGKGHLVVHCHPNRCFPPQCPRGSLSVSVPRRPRHGAIEALRRQPLLTPGFPPGSTKQLPLCPQSLATGRRFAKGGGTETSKDYLDCRGFHAVQLHFTPFVPSPTPMYSLPVWLITPLPFSFVVALKK